MIIAPITFLTAGILAIIYIFLSLNVASFRRKNILPYGDGANAEMVRRVRAHANFSEYVPLILLLIFFAEIAGTPKFIVSFLAIMFVIARSFHIYGVLACENCEQPGFRKYIPRMIGMTLTMAIILVVALINITAGISYLLG